MADVDQIEAMMAAEHAWTEQQRASLDAEETPLADGWRIRDLDELNRVLGRMARLDRIREENREVVAKEVARKQEWLAKEDEALAKRYRDLAAHVEVFARDNREALGKTRRLPNGVVAWRERKEGAYRWRQDMPKAEREAALLAWAKAEQSSTLRPLWEAVEVERPNLDTIKAHLGTRAVALQDSPRAPPGLEWVGPGESLSIVVKEKP